VRFVRKAACAFVLALLLLPWLLGAAAHGGNSRPNYVPLAEWARANVFSVHWLERDKTVELTGHGSRLTFNVDSRSDARRAQINGVQVFLAVPILYQSGRAYISQIDLSQTLRPVLSPPANPRGFKLDTICLDAGHGGNDPGYQVGSNDEKKYTLLLAQEVRTQLKAAGYNVVMTRTTDVKIPLEDRTAIARKAGADLFVCLHFNAFPEDKQVKGTEIYCCTPAGAFSFNAKGEGDTRWVVGNRNDEKNIVLAYQMMKSYERNLGFEDRGVKRARYQVLREATMPAILIEGGFMSNPADGKKIFDPAYRKQMAKAVVDGIQAYKTLVKGPEISQKKTKETK
jgi:N-acetylmuramoyl-L-alanine amidase